MKKFEIPRRIFNYIAGGDVPPKGGAFFSNINPHNGKEICQGTRSSAQDVDRAVAAAHASFADWAGLPPVQRGEVLYEIISAMERYKEDIAAVVALETGKNLKSALGETSGAIALARFYAGEGQRLYGRTTTSGVRDKYALTIREPVGTAALIIAANTPIANVAWKLFPALICGNTVVLKASEDAPLTSWIMGKIVDETSLPKGVFNIIQGLGEEAGAPLVGHKDVHLISFTGSTRVGRWIAETAGKDLKKISLELGGKNPLVVCDDADLDNAVRWSSLSAFSNAGQRCASASRIIVFTAVYEAFKQKLINTAESLKLGVEDSDDLGPVINERQIKNMLMAVDGAVRRGACVLCGGKRLSDDSHKNGYYIGPTVIEGADPDDEISGTELFGPIVCLYKAQNFTEALALANRSPYGLTSSIHTTNVHRAAEFSRKIHCGVAVINGGTFGSEPHMPFGGVKSSGNGTREPGTEALDIYSNLKDIYQFVDSKKLN